MSTTRAKVKLDEQSFEALLAAAYTVQEHNDKQKRAGEVACHLCGNMLESKQQFCGRCGALREEFRPGERMQRKWASLWTMSQRQSKQSNFAAGNHPAGIGDLFPADNPIFAEAAEVEQPSAGVESGSDQPESLLLAPLQLEFAEEPQFDDTEPQSSDGRHMPMVLRFRREDLYLGMAILVSALALLWVIWAAPVSRNLEKSRLTLWQRGLVKLGIAEAPRVPAVYHGDPTVKVWADPHTALYYCDGAEQFGKTPDGHFSTQREAQMDSFSPAERTPCD